MSILRRTFMPRNGETYDLVQVLYASLTMMPSLTFSACFRGCWGYPQTRKHDQLLPLRACNLGSPIPNSPSDWLEGVRWLEYLAYNAQLIHM